MQTELESALLVAEAAYTRVLAGINPHTSLAQMTYFYRLYLDYSGEAVVMKCRWLPTGLVGTDALRLERAVGL